MNPICDQVAERVALGEPLGEHADHAASCARCRRLVALPVELAVVKRDADPGMGFVARMTAGAQHVLVVRRRRRIAVTAATAVAAAAALAVVVMRPADEAGVAFVPPVLPKRHQAMEPQHHQKDPWDTSRGDDDVRALVHLANIDRSSHLSANWGRIEKPLAPYRAVLKGNQP
jgi:hypothetical protein